MNANLNELVAPLPREWQRKLEAMEEDNRQRFTELLISTQHVRVAYGYDPNPPEPLTFEEMKAGETRNAQDAVEDAIMTWGGTKQGEEWLHHWFSHGPNHDRDLPYFAYMTVMADCWPDDAEVDLVSWAWTEPAWPEANLGTAAWRKLWARVGYLHETRMVDDDDDPSTRLRDYERPSETLVLYRGAIASRKRGMAWTTNPERAMWFRNHMSPANGVKRNGVLRQANVYRCTVTPDRLYAHFEGRGEDEWVVDARSIPIENVTEEVRALLDETAVAQ